MSIGLDDPKGNRIAELREIKINGLPGIGVYTLILNMHFLATQPKVVAQIRNISARVEWGDNSQRIIGMALSDNSSIQISPYSTVIQAGFRLPITATQIEDIERRRNGADFMLSLWLTTEIEQEGLSKNNYGRHEFLIRQQDWLEALAHMEYQKTLLFELSVPGSDTAIGTLISKAQRFLNIGDYDQAVALCRQTLEKIAESAGDKSTAARAVKKYREDRESMDTTERLLFLRESLKNATHLSVHNSQVHNGYSRDQAKAILATTIALISLY